MQAIIDVWAQPSIPKFLQGLPEVRKLAERSGSIAAMDNWVASSELIRQMNVAGVKKCFFLLGTVPVNH